MTALLRLLGAINAAAAVGVMAFHEMDYLPDVWRWVLASGVASGALSVVLHSANEADQSWRAWKQSGRV